MKQNRKIFGILLALIPWHQGVAETSLPSHALPSDTALAIYIHHPDAGQAHNSATLIEKYLAPRISHLSILPQISSTAAPTPVSSTAVRDWQKRAEAIEQYYYQGNFSAVMDQTDDVIQGFTELPWKERSSNTSSEWITKLLTFQALSHRVSGNTKAYHRLIQTLIIRNPSIVLSPAIFSKNVITDVEHTKRSKMVNHPHFFLDLSSSPPEADVYINETHIGKTPIIKHRWPKTLLPSTAHHVTVTKNGFQPLSLHVSGYNNTDLRVPLIPIPQGNAQVHHPYAELSSQLPMDVVVWDRQIQVDATLLATCVKDTSSTVSNPDLWLLDYTPYPDAFHFCLYLRNQNRWWCDAHPISAATLPTVIEDFWLSYERTKKSPLATLPTSSLTSSALGSSSLPAPPLTASPPSSLSSRLLFWGGVALACGIAAFLVGSQIASPPSPVDLAIVLPP